MSDLALNLLRQTAQSRSGIVEWTQTTARSDHPLCHDLPSLGAHSTPGQIDRVNSALAQLVSMGLVRKHGDQFRITLAGKCFANAYHLLDRCD